ncbi:hypothetical protein HGRIS_011256 [Hohenbuehelia grisea]|uniref:Uncharacterized protein n=1 Tax=Hohenbuehelia grisea TaxID=104357 RepID=A0ABR3JVH4_9AGAR
MLTNGQQTSRSSSGTQTTWKNPGSLTRLPWLKDVPISNNHLRYPNLRESDLKLISPQPSRLAGRKTIEISGYPMSWAEGGGAGSSLTAPHMPPAAVIMEELILSVLGKEGSRTQKVVAGDDTADLYLERKQFG